MRRYARHEFRLAIEDCDTALIAYPEDAEIYSNRGSAHFMLNEAILAISDFSAAIRLKPDNPNLHYNRATAYAALGEHAKAIDGFTDTIRFGPKFFPASTAASYSSGWGTLTTLSPIIAKCSSSRRPSRRPYGTSGASAPSDACSCRVHRMSTHSCSCE
jgi:tetratricopeptide (TPR) repeat protein